MSKYCVEKNSKRKILIKKSNRSTWDKLPKDLIIEISQYLEETRDFMNWVNLNKHFRKIYQQNDILSKRKNYLFRKHFLNELIYYKYKLKINIIFEYERLVIDFVQNGDKLSYSIIESYYNLDNENKIFDIIHSILNYYKSIEYDSIPIKRNYQITQWLKSIDKYIGGYHDYSFEFKGKLFPIKKEPNEWTLEELFYFLKFLKCYDKDNQLSEDKLKNIQSIVNVNQYLSYNIANFIIGLLQSTILIFFIFLCFFEFRNFSKIND